MRIHKLCLLLIIAVLAACGSSAPNQPAVDRQDSLVVTVFKDPACGCCSAWIDYLAESGFLVETKDVQHLAAVKAQHQVPPDLQSCHTAILDGYIIEGHVPVAEMEWLLGEQPDISGIAVPGMPIGSPGMVVQGVAPQPFDVIAWSKDGQTQVFASHLQ